VNTFSISFLVINGAFLLLLPKRWALLPLLMGACYITRGQITELGPFHFSVLRILIGVGMVRLILRGERLESGSNGLDWLMLAWAFWLLLSSSYHENPSAALITRLGNVYDACGIYLLVRVFCRSFDDLEGLFRLVPILLVPVALEMIYEKIMVTNLFSILADGFATPAIREGNIRARGPFAHAINGGTLGAVCLPLIVPLWRNHRKVALIGVAACLVIIFTSGSSGPIMSAVAGIAALLMWNYRHLTRVARWMGVGAYIALELVMKDPAYYIIARIDIAGGSASWHRARLIQSAIEHLSEWWLVGTDYTRHWMPSGVSWSPNHTDITSHYLQMGVMGGLPLMVLFIAVLAKGFSFVGQTLRERPELSPQSMFMFWALGASLFAHATTFISVAYFDQSFVFLYLTLACMGSIESASRSANASAVSEQYKPDSLGPDWRVGSRASD
jgi:hypothetical protein